MHFGDKEVVEAQSLTIVVYKHSVSGKEGEKLPDHIELQSIFQCSHYSSFDIVRLHFEIHHIMKEPMANLDTEHWYAVELTINANDDFVVESITCVDGHPNELYRIH